MDCARNDPELATEVITLLGKELKSARKRISELESQILHGDREDYIMIDDSKERAEVAEASVAHLKAEVEKIRIENAGMKVLLEKWRKTYLPVKEEATEEQCSIPPPEESYDEPNLDLENKVTELQAKVEVYYGKYKAQKDAKKKLRQTVAELEIQVDELNRENRKLNQAVELNSSKVTPAKDPFLPGHREFVAFMIKFPQCDRPHYSRLQPVCHRGVDIKAYLDSDSKLAKFADSFLYLPGRLQWCSFDSQHGLAFGPQHVLNISTGRWQKKSTFEAQYGKSLEVFYTARSLIFYAGTYTCHNLRSWSPEGSPMPSERLYAEEFARATVENSDYEQKSLNRSIERMYVDQVLKVEVMGLQCIGFNSELYEALDQRFKANLPVLGKREGSLLEGSEPAKKSRSTTP